MNREQLLILAILVVTIAMFLWGRWRHDMVAMGALLACVVTGLVPADGAFAGFGHPAVVTVACILVLSRALQTSGAVDALAQRVLPRNAGPALTVAALTGLVALLSAFMNNVGALALLMPIAIQIASRQDMPPGRILMPLAFGSMLGGMTTLIGTPPNLIVAGFRAEASGGPGFGMFDFTPVGLAVALAGIAFITLIGWRLVPDRRRAGAGGFDAAAYLTEARVAGDAKAVGMTLREVEGVLEESGAQVVGMIRDEERLRGARPWRRVRAGDILMLEAEPEALASAMSSLGLHLEEAVEAKKAVGELLQTPADDGKAPADDEVVLQELAVLPGSMLAGRSASDIRLRSRHGINLLGVSRRGRIETNRLRAMRLQAGDVLLMQGPEESIAEFASDRGCVPLAARELRLPNRRQIVVASGVMGGAVGAAAFGLVPAAVAFAAGVLVAMATRAVPPRSVYAAVDWTVIVLLAALIPVAGAMETTGAAEIAARALVDGLARGNAVIALVLILVATMTLSDIVNNAATAAVMCPIGIGTAASLGVSADPFLIAVGIGASCAFLTPIGHQNNTLILGPGGFRFGDYWPLGLPLEIVVLVVAVPAILLFWPM